MVHACAILGKYIGKNPIVLSKKKDINQSVVSLRLFLHASDCRHIIFCGPPDFSSSTTTMYKSSDTLNQSLVQLQLNHRRNCYSRRNFHSPWILAYPDKGCDTLDCRAAYHADNTAVCHGMKSLQG